MMPLILALAASVSFECQVPDWRVDQVSATRDSADLIVRGMVVAVRLLAPPEVTEEEWLEMPYEATLLVERSWLAPVDSLITVRVQSIECDPNPEFLGTHTLSLKARDHGWWVFAALDDDWFGPIGLAERDSLFADLGEGTPPVDRAAAQSHRTWLLWLTALAVACAGAFVVLRRRTKVGRAQGVQET